MTEPTQRISPNGSWRNSTVIEQNRAGESHRGPHTQKYAAPPARARFAALRIFICILFTPLCLYLAASGALAFWVQSTIIDEQGFASISDELAQDSTFQEELAQAATNDIMSSEPLSSYLGGGNESGLLGSVQNFAHQQVQSSILNAATTVVQSETYPQVWNQIMADTHSYNLNSTDKPAALDLSALYSAIDTRVGSFMGYDPDIAGGGNQILTIDTSADNPIHRNIISAKNYASSWAIQTGLSLIGLLLTLLLWPRGRFYFASAIALIAGCGAWVLSEFTRDLALVISASNISTEVGSIFIERIAESMEESLAHFTSSLTPPLLLLALALFLVGLARQISRVTARATTAHTRN